MCLICRILVPSRGWSGHGIAVGALWPGDTTWRQIPWSALISKASAILPRSQCISVHIISKAKQPLIWYPLTWQQFVSMYIWRITHRHLGDHIRNIENHDQDEINGIKRKSNRSKSPQRIHNCQDARVHVLQCRFFVIHVPKKTARL